MAWVFVDPVESPLGISTEGALKETFDRALGRFWSLDKLEYLLGTKFDILQLCVFLVLVTLVTLFNARCLLLFNVQIHARERIFALPTETASHGVLLLANFGFKHILV